MRSATALNKDSLPSGNWLYSVRRACWRWPCLWPLLLSGGASVAALVLAVNLLDFGVQSGQVANQTRIFGLGDTIRGRLNSIYMVTTFTGDASGALAGGWTWSIGSWQAVCALAAGLIVLAGLVLAWSGFYGQQTNTPVWQVPQ